ncbi:MAG: hypothetical protein U9O55_02985 [Patescibacteria group bacterium]|nr:hypothetical protein [Patescibacteria group bacterium]
MKERIIFLSLLCRSKIVEISNSVKVVYSKLKFNLKHSILHSQIWSKIVETKGRVEAIHCRTKQRKSILYLKIILKFFIPENWNDKRDFVTKTVKEDKEGKTVFKEVNVVDANGKSKKEIISEGRKHGRWKRLRNFVFAVSALLFMYFAVGALGEKLLFKIFFPLLLTVIWFWPFWPIKEHLNKKKVIFSITIFIVLLTLFLTYPLAIIIQHAVLWVLILAFLTFIIEEITGKDLYPAAVVVIGIVTLLISLLLGLVDLFHDHSYYVQKTNLTVNEELAQTQEWEKAKARLSLSKKITLGMHLLLPEEKDENFFCSIKKLAGLSIKGCCPAEFNRVGSVIGRLVFFFSFLTIYILLLFIFIPEIAWKHIEEARKKHDKKSKGATGKEGLSAMAYISFDMLGSILHEFIQGRGKKKG